MSGEEDNRRDEKDEDREEIESLKVHQWRMIGGEKENQGEREENLTTLGFHPQQGYFRLKHKPQGYLRNSPNVRGNLENTPNLRVREEIFLQFLVILFLLI